MSQERKGRGSRSGTHRGSRNDGSSRSVRDFVINISKLHEELSVLRFNETELDFDGALGTCVLSRGHEGDVKRLRITGDYISGRLQRDGMDWAD